MKDVKISLRSVSDIREFNAIVNHSNVRAFLEMGNYTIDARSLMGIFSFELNRPIDMHIDTDGCEDFLNNIGKFLVN